MTSEGIFVFTRSNPPAEILVGNSLSVTGSVEEYRPRNDTTSTTITEISHRIGQDTIKIASKDNALPMAMPLTVSDSSPNTFDQFEKYEGMRVTIGEMTVVAPTGGRVDTKTASSVSDGVFFGVVKGLPRPFREPGLDIREFISSPDKDKIRKDFAKLQIFDSNPEILRVDSNEQFVTVKVDLSDILKRKNTVLDAPFSAPSINVTGQTVLSNLSGVMHYIGGRYTIFADYDKKVSASSTIKSNPLPKPNDRQFSVAGMNLENFFDDQDDPGIKEDIVAADAFQKRLKKISAAIRDVMQMPDVIGVIEAENLAALKRLGQKINADALAAGKPDPKYEAFLVDGNDGRGIDNGLLVKTSRVTVLETKQLGKDDKYKNPNTGADNFLNDRTPLMLRASIMDSKSGKPFEFTVVVNHMKSFLGYNDPKQQDNVRLKKRLQAEYLAKFVQDRQKANANERIILLGDFNAFQFNDGVLDLIGTIKGKPAAKDEVFNASEDLVNPDLIDLVDVIDAKQRYSYSFDGNAQVLDHIIITESLRNHINGFGFARLNADFPEVFRNDDSRPERFSDHDPAVAYFTFDDVTAGKTP
jgi:predicted extracellular nuclease